METSDGQHTALKITGKDNTFDTCEIHGGAEVAGQGNKFSRTKFYGFYRRHKKLSWGAVISFFLLILAGAANAIELYHFFVPTTSSPTLSVEPMESNVAIGNTAPVSQTLIVYKSKGDVSYTAAALNAKTSDGLFHSQFAITVSNVPPKGVDLYPSPLLDCTYKKMGTVSMLDNLTIKYAASCTSTQKVVDNGKLFWLSSS